MDEYKLLKKYYHKKTNKEKAIFDYDKYLFSIINKTLISVLLFLICLCGIKLNNNIKEFIRQNVYEKNISFAVFNDLYKSVFGKPSKIVENVLDYKKNDVDMVFDEKISYKEKIEYENGIKLIVNSNYLIPIQESGIVVFIGKKDNYGNTVIIQQINGVDMWYSGVDNLNIKLYDYVEKGKILGETIGNELMIFYQEDGKFVDYKKYF